MAFRSVPRPSSPPGAKASTECPYHTPIQSPLVSRQSSDHEDRTTGANGATMHGNHRQSQASVVSRQLSEIADHGPPTPDRDNRRISINHLGTEPGHVSIP